VKDRQLERELCIKFRVLPVVLMQRFWHHSDLMQNDPQGEDRPASAARSLPEISVEASPPSGLTEPVVVTEIGGPKGPEPTRFGDWEKNGRCIDF
jgi:hypothetical protein